MANTIKLRRSATSGSVPTTSQLALGELAMNTYDGKLFLKTDQSGTEAIVEVGSGGGSTITIASATPSVGSSNVGDIYWDSDEGNPYILYDDGNGSAQWVALVATAAGTPADTEKLIEGNTEAEVVDTGSDGHFKVTTEGTERVRVGPAGQVGIAGANYGTSGQVLTSGGATGAISWADAASGATGGGNDQWVVETDQTVTTSYELSANKHGTAVSPTINSGATVTVPSGAILVIL